MVHTIFLLQGPSKIEAIDLYKEGSYTAEQFKELTDLRLLKMINVKFTGDFHIVLPQLRWLECQNCPLDLEVASFHTKKLVVLDMSYTHISEDWRGWSPLKVRRRKRTPHALSRIVCGCNHPKFSFLSF